MRSNTTSNPLRHVYTCSGRGYSLSQTNLDIANYPTINHRPAPRIANKNEMICCTSRSRTPRGSETKD